MQITRQRVRPALDIAYQPKTCPTCYGKGSDSAHQSCLPTVLEDKIAYLVHKLQGNDASHLHVHPFIAALY